MMENRRSLDPAPSAHGDTIVHVIAVDLDDRCFVFPGGKGLTQIKLSGTDRGDVVVEAVYAYNAAKASPLLLTLTLEDARELCKRLVEAVYRAQTQHVISDTVRVTINVIANGYHIQIGDTGEPLEVLLSPSVIWRVCNGLCKVVDAISPIVAH